MNGIDRFVVVHAVNMTLATEPTIPLKRGVGAELPSTLASIAMATSGGSLAVNDVRALLRLVGELRELGADPLAWRSHLAESLERLCQARAVYVGELAPQAAPPSAEQATLRCVDMIQVVQAIDRGLDAGERGRFYDDVVWHEHGPSDPLAAIVPLYGTSFSVGRRDLVDDRAWYASALANERFRAHDCDDFILSMVAVPGTGLLATFELFRPWQRSPFGERERLVVNLLHEALTQEWQEPPGQRGMAPRLRQVAQRLASGASEKEIAHDLELSPHTVHDYIKALHRRFGVRSRGELLARLGQDPRPRIRLAQTSS